MNGYRVVLRAYPKGPRREELFDTLTESGRTRPALREIPNLLRHGMRARLGRPAGRGIVVIAVLIALSTGLLGAAVASRLAWETAPDFPHGARLAAIQETVFPGMRHRAERDSDALFLDIREPSVTEVLLHGHDEDVAFATLAIGPEDRFVRGDYRAWTETTAARLAASGWDVGPTVPTGATEIATGRLMQDGTDLKATRGGITMTVEALTSVVDTPPGSFEATATLERRTPAHVSVLTWLGWLAGALVGWLLTGWVSRRTEHASAGVRSLTREPAVVALVLLTPLTLAGTLILLVQTAGGPPGVPFWFYSVTYGYGLTRIAALISLVPVVAAALCGGRDAAPAEAPS
ncbi:hypothetical protein [Actinoplanes sp. NPDC049316]|uniref:hypothetical protein n=1 Tax=Actinoplanes sp. NPDC049316 TaxID=3154727 RepID=UPI00343FF045